MKTENDLQMLASKIKDIRFTMLATVAPNGFIYSRPMANGKINPKTFDGKLWFFTKKNTPKVNNIENDQHVNLAYTDFLGQHFISISGMASLSQDRTKIEELWTHDMHEWFPQGLNDADLSLICVTAHSAEIWDSPSGKMIPLIKLARAMTGKRIDTDHQGHIINVPH